MPSTPAPAAAHSKSDLIYIDRATIGDLKERQLFSAVGDEELLRSFQRDSFICTLKAKGRLQLTRESTDYLYVIIRGHVVIWAPSRFNREDTFLAWRGPEQIIGEMRTIGVEPPAARIIACDDCDLLEMRLDTFSDLAKNNSQIYENIANLLVKKMVWERHRSDVIPTVSKRQRIAQALMYFAEERCTKEQLRAEGSVEIPGTFHQDELAQYVAVVKRTVGEHLSELKMKKIISYRGSNRGTRFTILNMEELEKIARNADLRTHTELKDSD